MKRANGTGTVYKRRTDSGKRRTPYVAMVTIGYDKKGKRIRKIIGSFSTVKEAQKCIAEYVVSPNKYENGDITFGQIWEELKKDHKFNRQYLGAWRNHIHVLEKLPMVKIKAFQLQNVIDESGLSGGAQQRLKTIYKLIYAFAIANDIVDKDYSQFVKIAPKVKSEKHHPFTSEEMQFMWKNSDNDIFKIVLIQCYTGTRQQELARVKVDNIHLADHYMVGGMKTEAGRNRSIPIADCIMPFVQYFYNIALFKKSDTLLIPGYKRFFYSKAGILDITTIYREALPKLGIKGHSAHDGRHTFVTLADNYGINETSIKMIVGHSQSGDVTKDIYTHKVIPQLVQAVNELPHGDQMKMYPEENGGSHLVATD